MGSFRGKLDPLSTGLPEKEENMKGKFLKIAKIAALSLAGLVLLVSLSAVIYCACVGATTFEEGKAAIGALFGFGGDDVYGRKSYTVSDKKAAAKQDVVVATVGGQDLTNGQLQVGYWMNVYDYLNNYGQYAIYSGLDYTQPLDEQDCAGTDGTWQQFLLSDALDKWHSYQAMALLAGDKGITLAETFQANLDGMRESMTATATENGYESLDAMIQSDMGPGCTFEDYYDYMAVYYLGYMYYADCYSKLEVTDELVEAYFSQYETELAENKITKTSGDVVDIRQIYIEPEGGVADENDDMTYTDEAWEAARAEAQAILDEWQAGDQTETSFSALAAEYSDNDSAESDGGLIESVYEGYLTDELDAWCFDEEREAGNCELVKTKYGYHVVYFVMREAEWYRECSEGVVAQLASEIMETAKEQYPMTVDYSKIVLGEVDLSGE